MKKTTKNGLVALLAITLAACGQMENEPTFTPKSQLSFTGIIDQTVTRTAVGSDGAVTWTDGDEISINGVTFSASVNPSNAAEGLFTKLNDEDPDPEATFEAIYPASLYDKETGFAFPEIQQYSAEGANAPMYATGDDAYLYFSNISSLLKITLKDASEEPAKLRALRVTADKGLSGAFTLTQAVERSDAYVAQLKNDDLKTVYLDCGTQGVALSAEGSDFYVSIPANTYGFLTIVATTVDGKTWIMRTQAESVQVSANHIYPMSFTPEFASVPDGCVDLGLSVYWSDRNLLAESEEEFGEFYTWADTIPGYGNSKWYVSHNWTKYNGNDNLITIEPEDDAATHVLGTPWRIPTKDEFEELINSKLLSWEWDATNKGYRITSKILGYQGNAIYLPGAGYKYGSIQTGFCRYWSSTVQVTKEYDWVDTNFAYALNATSSSIGFRGEERNCGLPIRPVMPRK